MLSSFTFDFSHFVHNHVSCSVLQDSSVVSLWTPYGNTHFFFLTKSFALLFNIYGNFSVIKRKIAFCCNRKLCLWSLFDIYEDCLRFKTGRIILVPNEYFCKV